MIVSTHPLKLVFSTNFSWLFNTFREVSCSRSLASSWFSVSESAKLNMFFCKFTNFFCNRIVFINSLVLVDFFHFFIRPGLQM